MKVEDQRLGVGIDLMDFSSILALQTKRLGLHGFENISRELFHENGGLGSAFGFVSGWYLVQNGNFQLLLLELQSDFDFLVGFKVGQGFS